VLNQILGSTLKETEGSVRQIYEHHGPIMKAISELGTPLPKILATIVGFVLSEDMLRVLENDPPDLGHLAALAEQTLRWSVDLDTRTLGFVATQRIEHLVEEWLRDPRDTKALERIESTLRLLSGLSLEIDLWKAQNVYFMIGRSEYDAIAQKAGEGDEKAGQWLERFSSLGDYLGVRIA
jgi:hypothetical protein